MNPLIELLILATIATLEHDRHCPECGEWMDSGMGFGKRDLECSEWDGEDDTLPDACTFSFSYPIDIYFAFR